MDTWAQRGGRGKSAEEETLPYLLPFVPSAPLKQQVCFLKRKQNTCWSGGDGACDREPLEGRNCTSPAANTEVITKQASDKCNKWMNTQGRNREQRTLKKCRRDLRLRQLARQNHQRFLRWEMTPWTLLMDTWLNSAAFVTAANSFQNHFISGLCDSILSCCSPGYPIKHSVQSLRPCPPFPNF